jgi:acyl transferase domain-containing protein
MKSTSPSTAARPDQLLLWSADTQEALDTSTRSLTEYLAGPDCGLLQDVAYTLQTGRPARPYRRMLVGRDPQDAARTLSAPTSSAPSKQVLTHHFQGGPRAPVFMFPGLGVHYTNMALGLYQSEPVFREELEICLDLLASTMGSDFRSIL